MTTHIHHGLLWMQAEFESNQLQIALVPCKRHVNEGGCIRVAMSRNADWYRKFCSAHLASRQTPRNKSLPDTRIKRRNVERLLTRLVAGRPSRSKYVPELLKTAAKFAAKAQKGAA